MKRRLYSKTIGLPVIAEHSPYMLATVSDFLIDSATGKIIAFLLSGKKVIVPLDILEWNNHILIGDESHILEAHEVIRVKEQLRHNIPLFANKVFTENGTFIGRVYDMAFDATTDILLEIYAAKTFLFFRFDERIIERSKILDVRQDRIIIKDILGKKREKSEARSSEWLPA